MDRSKKDLISALQAKGLIAEQFPRLRPLRLARLGQGWDNAAFLVDGKYVFRFAIRDVALPLLRTEAAVLPWLAPRLPLPVPRPSFVGEGFVGYRLVRGRPASRTALSDSQRAASASVLGRFLRALHRCAAAEARRHGAGGDEWKRVDVAHRIALTEPRLRKLKRWGLLENQRRLRKILQETRAARAKPVLLHGDPHAGQLLVDEKRKVCAVIDWGDLHIGHPAVDLSIAHTFLPPAAHAAFRKAYGPIPEDVWRLARFRAVTVMAALAEHAYEHKDRAMLRVGLKGLAFAAAG